MADGQDEVRVVALVPAEMQETLRLQLAPIGVTLDFISEATDLSQEALRRTLYHVALLPAALPDNGWWSLWGEITLFCPQPEILVYAQTASFQLWSGVLEVGGYDIIIEPFTEEEIQRSVLRAARSFKERCSDDGNE